MAEECAGHADEAAGPRRRGRRPRARRPRPAVAAPVPDREADLDLVLHSLQRGPDPAHTRRLLRGDRDPRLEALVVLADRDRRELDRDLRDELDARALRLGEPEDPPRLRAVP